jgi:Zn/Cd-binding protein ZinT
MTPATCTPAQLHRHANEIERTAARGVYQDEQGKDRRLSQAARDAWAADAAILREHAYNLENRDAR